MNFLKQIARSIAQYHTFRATLAELNGCSDRQLADMGFTRGDIVRVAYEAAEYDVARGPSHRRTTPAGLPRTLPAAG